VSLSLVGWHSTVQEQFITEGIARDLSTKKMSALTHGAVKSHTAVTQGVIAPAWHALCTMAHRMQLRVVESGKVLGKQQHHIYLFRQ
jgi:hypothetical protein